MKFKIFLLVLVMLVKSNHTQQNTTNSTTFPDFDSTEGIITSIPEDEIINNIPEIDPKTNKMLIDLDNRRTGKETLVRGIDKDSILEFTEISFQVSEAKLKYQLELEIDVRGQISFSDCLFEIIYPDVSQPECLEAFRVILKSPDGVLKIYRKVVTEAIIIKHRLVISGCDKETQVRRIVYKPGMPMIIHNSPVDCLYQIDLRTETRNSLKLQVTDFPKLYEACQAFIQINQASDENDLVGVPQAYFNSWDTIVRFGQEVVANSQFALITMTNCYENSEPIIVEFDRITKNAGKFDSRMLKGFIKPPKSSVVYYNEIEKENSDFYFKIRDFMPLNEQISKFSLLLYAVNAQQQLNWYRFSDNASFIPFEQVLFKGFNKVYLQYTRGQLLPSTFLLDVQIKPEEVTVRKLSNPSGSFNSQIDILGSLVNKKFKFQIETEHGTQIILNLTKFNNNLPAQSNIDHTYLQLSRANIPNQCESNDHVIIKINKQTQRLTTLYSENTDPKICDQIQTPQTFQSFSNKLTLIVSLSSRYMSNSVPFINFDYTSIKTCGAKSTKMNQIVTYSSIDGHVKSGNESLCIREIEVPSHYRIMMYRTDWKLDEEGYLFDQTDHSSEMVNGRLACKGSDSVTLTESLDEIKNQMDFPMSDNKFCMSNPLNTFVTKTNKLYMSFHTPPNTKQRPLVLEAGYFAYKHLYNTNTTANIFINFADIIPQHISHKQFNYTTSFDIKFQVPSISDMYFMPILSDCNLRIEGTIGKINVRTSSGKDYMISDKACGSGSVIGEQNTHLTFQFQDVELNILRSQRVKFRLQYEALPRVFTSSAGSFESNSFKYEYLSRRADFIEYEWNINLPSDQFIQLDIEKLTNQDAIQELFIIDSNKNVTLYDITSIVKLRTKSFLIAASRLTIRFSHLKNLPRSSVNVATILPFIKCSYVARSRVIQAGLKGGDLRIAGLNVKDALNWLLIAPRDYFIVVKIKEFESNGQLKFSLLSDNYNPTGFYHYDKTDLTNNKYDQKTTVFISKSNRLDIKYLPNRSTEQDTFTLIYSIHKTTLTTPSGILKPFINDLTSPIIFTPKQTEQSWTIKAPYKKTITIFYHFVDLLAEVECSKSSIKVLDEKSNLLLNVCDHASHSLTNVDLTNQIMLKSNTNELQLHFMTHNYNEIVYWLDEDLTPVLFRGFELFYAFDEEIGDCYFQKRSDLTCGYKAVKGFWNIDRPEQKMIGTADNVNDYKDILCMDCHLTAEIALSEDMEQILESPVISRDKEYVKFTYKLTRNAELYVHLVYDVNGTRSEPILIRQEPAALRWKHVTLRLGKSEQDFRIQFTLKKHATVIESTAPEVNLDNIQFFENNFECESHEFPEVCSRNQLVPTNIPTMTSASERFGLCKLSQFTCDLNLCQNEAVCLNSQTSYVCMCSNGFTGKNCETKLEACDVNKCSENSECLSSETDPKGYTCSCSQNYHGEFCLDRYTPCKLAFNPCNQLNGHGTCQDTATALDPLKYQCTCSQLYSGPECETKRQVDCASDCQTIDTNAQCDQINGQTICQCSPGFRGDQCQINQDDCLDIKCQNNSTCIDGINKFTCQCGDKFTGQFCEKALICDKCNPEGTQHCNQNTAKCECLSSHSGEFCETLTNPCSSKPCHNEGKCHASKTSATDFKCFCPWGFTGDRCESIMSKCDHLECLNGGVKTCLDTIGLDMPCNCTSNFGGKFCENYLTPCDTNPCQNEATCSNTAVGHKCHCRPGFTGRDCETEIKDASCEQNMCQNGGCLAILGSYICVCEPGFMGKFCDVKDRACDNNFCQNGRCIPNGGDDYTCACHEGYEGWHCDKKIDMCGNADCHDGKCIDEFNRAECLCPLGTAGFTCQPTKYCSLEATECNRNSTLTCLNTQAGNRCNCIKGYGGNRCETLLDACEYTTNPCYNSGKCIPTGLDQYKCINCAPGYTGQRCETPIDHCTSSDPCLNGATCLSLLNDYLCKCQEGFQGKNCSIKMQIECVKNHCQNNSTCVPNKIKFPDAKDTSGYFCECDMISEGMYCEREKDLCKGVSCDYGFCEKGECKCDPRLPYCDRNQKCLNYTCENGGTCVDVLEGSETRAQCICPPGLTGANCELSVYCETMGADLCGDKSNCKVSNGSYRCDCELPNVGHGCKNVIDDLIPVFVMQLRSEKLVMLNEACKFGSSKQSQLLIAIVLIFIFIFTMIGFISGHRLVRQYKKKLETSGSCDTINKQTEHFSYSDQDFISPLKTPTNRKTSEITGGFSIPRPSVRTFV